MLRLGRRTVSWQCLGGRRWKGERGSSPEAELEGERGNLVETEFERESEISGEREGKGGGGGEGGGRGGGGGEGGGEEEGERESKWESSAYRRQFLDQVAHTHSVKSASDWRRVTKKDILRAGGNGLLLRFASVLEALRESYPEWEEEDWQVRRQLPGGYWSSAERRKSFFLFVAREVGIDAHDPDAWRAVTSRKAFELGGRGLLKRYDYSLAAALQDTFEEMAEADVSQWRQKVPQRYWEDAGNRRRFMETVARKKGLRVPSDWRSVRQADIVALGGGALLLRCGSVVEALEDAFPEQEWTVEECRERRPSGYWDKRENRRAFLDQLAEKHDISSAEDWAEVTKEMITEEGGRALLEKFPSTWAALKDAFEGGEERSEGTWDRYVSRKVLPSGHWEEEDNVRDFVLRLQERLHITSDEDWERVSNEQVTEVRGGGSLLRRWSLPEALAIAFPKKKWEFTSPRTGAKKAAQRRLRVAIQHVLNGWADERAGPPAPAPATALL